MLKATHVILRPSAAENVMLREFRKEAARCWNETVRIAKEYYHLNNRKWISANNLQKALKGQFQLHSQTVQALADKYVENRSTIATRGEQEGSVSLSGEAFSHYSFQANGLAVWSVGRACHIYFRRYPIQHGLCASVSDSHSGNPLS